ncbi:DUF3105 domain-containing protein [Microbacterium sp. ZXX196]|uniref:DUF3105 domain-containing protein n=1 Tax=Microbacterium sp. ZXX196 TaxID=2609291 RepID=UPI0012B93D9E|nr:DUF3105 domain-containing protein [Microbacterium sp. ZXX196]MTE23463.1 DUF3105 domain-containing protein [Microbacterium sp. ZXX196]
MAQGRSGNPAKRAEHEQTTKQRREERRQEKLAEYQRQLARSRRTKKFAWIGGSVAAVAVIAAIVTLYVTAPEPLNDYSAGSSGAAIEGVETFNNETEHVEGTVDYPQSPPAGGPHNAYWLNCGVYSEPQTNENAVHSLEHGAVWLTYDPEQVSEEDVELLESYAPSSYSILSPYPGMDTPIAVSAWNAQLKVDSANDERIRDFYEEYWRSGDVPEPGALCSGAVDGPGKVS